MSGIRTIRYSTMEDTFVRIKDLKVRIRRRLGSGPTMLLINGLGGCLEAWAPVTKRLPGYDIIALDHPGTGLTSPPNYIMSMPELAAFYMEALDILDVERAHVLGFSFGGTVAQQVAHDFPDRVSSLILVSSTPGLGGFPPEPAVVMTAANPLRYQIALVREIAAPIIYQGRVGRHPKLFEDELAGFDQHRATMLGLVAQLGAFMGWSSMPWLPLLNLPVLILCGEDDPMTVVGNSLLMASVIPGAEFHVYEEGGHLVIFDEPDLPMRHINTFLNRLTAEMAA